MVDVTCSEALFAEMSPRSNSPSMTARQAEILNFSFNRAGIAAHKLGTDYDSLIKSLSPIAETTIKDLKKSKVLTTYNYSNSEGGLFDGDKTFTPLHRQNTLTVINDLVGAWEDFTTPAI